jgi:hypothetical protein
MKHTRSLYMNGVQRVSVVAIGIFFLLLQSFQCQTNSALALHAGD